MSRYNTTTYMCQRSRHEGCPWVIGLAFYGLTGYKTCDCGCHEEENGNG